jgi:hypothetical protein
MLLLLFCLTLWTISMLANVRQDDVRNSAANEAA